MKRSQASQASQPVLCVRMNLNTHLHIRASAGHEAGITLIEVDRTAAARTRQETVLYQDRSSYLQDDGRVEGGGGLHDSVRRGRGRHVNGGDGESELLGGLEELHHLTERGKESKQPAQHRGHKSRAQIGRSLRGRNSVCSCSNGVRQPGGKEVRSWWKLRWAS